MKWPRTRSSLFCRLVRIVLNSLPPKTRLIARVEELVVALRLDVGVSDSKARSHKGTRLNTGMAVGDTTAPGAMPTTPLVAGKRPAPGSNSRFNVLFKQVESVAFTLCEDKGLSTSIATQLCNGKDVPSLERMVSSKKMLASSIERKYKESMSDSFLKRITEYTDVSKAPGLLKVILGLPLDQVRALVVDDGKLKEKLSMISSFNSAPEWKPSSFMSAPVMPQAPMNGMGMAQLGNMKQQMPHSMQQQRSHMMMPNVHNISSQQRNYLLQQQQRNLQMRQMQQGMVSQQMPMQMQRGPNAPLGKSTGAPGARP